jgi:hypothetical protein
VTFSSDFPEIQFANTFQYINMLSTVSLNSSRSFGSSNDAGDTGDAINNNNDDLNLDSKARNNKIINNDNSNKKTTTDTNVEEKPTNVYRASSSGSAKLHRINNSNSNNRHHVRRRTQSLDNEPVRDITHEEASTASLTAKLLLLRPPPWEERKRSDSKNRRRSYSNSKQPQNKSESTTTTPTAPQYAGVNLVSRMDELFFSSSRTLLRKQSQKDQHDEKDDDHHENNRLQSPRKRMDSECGTTTEAGEETLTPQQSSDTQATTCDAYLNQKLSNPAAAFNFAMEHRIFLKAALNLLTERDRHAPELGMMDPIILKSGPLKKASQIMNGVWKVKYVEIRRGMLSYYENATSDNPEQLWRKNIPLDASFASCRAVKLHQKALNFSPNGAIFEITETNHKNSNKRTSLWMASSREERLAWMQAISNAMVGGSVTRGDGHVDHRGIVRTVSGRSPFKTDLRKYLKVQSNIRAAKSEQEYLSAIRDLLSISLHVPVKWIAKQQQLQQQQQMQGMMLTGSSTNVESSNVTNSVPMAFHEETVALSVDQLWKDLQRDSVSINGKVFRGDSGHGPERILGALTRRILTVGRTHDDETGLPSSLLDSDLQESKALVYARDILLAGNRTRSGGDSYFCVDTLCRNADLVVVVPSGTEVTPIAIDVSEDDSDESFETRFHDKTGWIKSKNKLQRNWLKHFFVLSEGTLSYYQGANPRPHGLRGQVGLAEATISIVKRRVLKEDGGIGFHANNYCDQFIVTLIVKDGMTKDRQLMFESEEKMLDWVYALECVIKAKSCRRKQPNMTCSIEGDEYLCPSSISDILEGAKLSTLEHARKLGLNRDEVLNRIKNFSQRATSAVSVSVRACTEYKVCTTDPQGDEEQDTWVNIRAHFLQAFRITGGPNGRIMRGEEIVRLSVVDCIEPLPASAEAGLSPSSMRARLNRRMFRHGGSIDEDHSGALNISD